MIYCLQLLALLCLWLDNRRMRRIKKQLGATVRRGGVTFRVWAPFATRVDVVGTFTHDPIAMDREDGGYWSTAVAHAEPGHIYQYKITTADGHELYRNDPRARQLTATENGQSVIVANDFDWGDDIFVPIPREQQVIYEMHIGTFARPDASTAGTFDTAIERLDYLQDLGINMIELMPVTSMGYSQGWGYNPRDLFSIENALGGRHGLMTFVRACHDRSIGVIIDVVYNHLFSETLWQFDGWTSDPAKGGIYFYNDWRSDTPFGARPDYGRPEVRQFILDNVAMWFHEFRVDGLRVDSTIYMRNTEGRDSDPAHDIADAWSLLSSITELSHRIRPGAMMIAEDCAATDFITKPTDHSGCGFDAQWGLGFPHALRDTLGLTYGVPAQLTTLIDELLHRYNDDAFQKIIFADSHDTAANGSVRLNEAADPNGGDNLSAQQRLLTASAVTLTAPGVPMLLQGQEFLQEGEFNDWQALEWDKVEKHAGIVSAHKHLISLRLNEYGNTAGLLGQNCAIFHHNDHDKVLGYHRWQHGGAGDDTLVLVNFAGGNFSEYIVHLPLSGTWYIRFNSAWSGYSEQFGDYVVEAVTTDPTGMATISLPPHVVLVLSQDPLRT